VVRHHGGCAGAIALAAGDARDVVHAPPAAEQLLGHLLQLASVQGVLLLLIAIATILAVVIVAISHHATGDGAAASADAVIVPTPARRSTLWWGVRVR